MWIISDKVINYNIRNKYAVYQQKIKQRQIYSDITSQKSYINENESAPPPINTCNGAENIGLSEDY